MGDAVSMSMRTSSMAWSWSGVRDLQAVGLLPRERQALHAPIDAHAVVLVHHVIAGLERGQLRRGEPARASGPPPAAAVSGKDLVVGHHRHAGVLPDEAGG